MMDAIYCLSSSANIVSGISLPFLFLADAVAEYKLAGVIPDYADLIHAEKVHSAGQPCAFCAEQPFVIDGRSRFVV